MWDTVQTNTIHLSHDLNGVPHGRASFACSDTCDCQPAFVAMLAS